MKKIILLSLLCTSLVATMPLGASALDIEKTGQNLHQETDSLLAQRRNNQARPSQNRATRSRRYYVYYRNPRNRQWTLRGSNARRQDAQRAARQLQRRGFVIYIR